MTTRNDGGPAFPFGQISETTGQPVNGFYEPGMSLRDFFAAKAMQSIMSGHAGQLLEMKAIADENGTDLEGVIAHFAYKQADAMLKARENR